ncbi:hypothetical protein HUJ04_000743 [Dendroctonus ponderosae]|nr:hypothetical protein HUJ04_000743 [Dendroctonus ponderosae]
MSSHVITLKQDTEHHRCALPGEPWDIVPKFIEGGILVDLRRKLKRSTMIDKRHPLTKSYAPSLNRLKEAEKSHLVEHYYMIHPFSMFSFYFNMLVVVILIMHFIAAPVVYPLLESNWIINVILLPVNLVFISLIIITFSTGCYDETHNVVIMKTGYVAARYLRTYFIFDILSFLPQILRFSRMDEALQRKSFHMTTPILVILRYFRQVQYFWCLKVLQNLRLYYGFSTFTYKAVKLILHITVGLTDVPNHSGGVFLKHSEATLKMLMLVSNGHHNKEYLAELILSNTFILLGFVLHLAILVETTQIWSKYFNAGNQQITVYDSVNAYMRYKALPMTLRKRIYLYLEFKYQGHFYKESVIKKATSNFLRREILLAATKKNIRNIDMFGKFPANLLKRIRSHLVSEIFLPGDIIIRAGNAGQCMFILLAGTVVVTTSEDRAVCYLRDGSHFGEVALAFNLFRNGNVTAVTPCEIYKLDRHSFWTIMAKHPDLWKMVQNKAADQLVRAGDAANIVDTKQGKIKIKLIWKHGNLFRYFG